MLVEEVFAQAGTAAFQVGDDFTEFLDGLCLLGQKLALDKVAHLKKKQDISAPCTAVVVSNVFQGLRLLNSAYNHLQLCVSNH